jgi:hypothetical protein
MAEVAGLALSALGVASLYGATLQVLDQIAGTRTFAADLQLLQTRLNTAKTTLGLWGDRVGFTSTGSLAAEHHSVFDDEPKLYDVQSAITAIKDALSELQAGIDAYGTSPGLVGQQPVVAEAKEPPPTLRSWFRQKRTSSGKKIRWIQDKKRLDSLLDQILGLLSLLYHIAPPNDPAAAELKANLAQALQNNSGKHSLTLTSVQIAEMATDTASQSGRLPLRKP